MVPESVSTIADKCPKCGSKVENDDWAGPESGGMAAHCTNLKCDWGFNTTLY